VDILAKVMFSFTPDIVMSPLALPREILDRKIDELTQNLPTGALQAVLLQLKQRPTHAEQWGQSEAAAAAVTGKQRILRLEAIRSDTHTLADILSADPQIGAWYAQIPA
jgi:hypothetical protein